MTIDTRNVNTTGTSFRTFKNGLNPRAASVLTSKNLSSTGSSLLVEDGKPHAVDKGNEEKKWSAVESPSHPHIPHRRVKKFKIAS
jgi:hypothetical protein